MLGAALSTPSSKLFSASFALLRLSAVTKRECLTLGCNFFRSFLQGARPQSGQREIIQVFRRGSTPKFDKFRDYFAFQLELPTIARKMRKNKASELVHSLSHRNPS